MIAKGFHRMSGKSFAITKHLERLPIYPRSWACGKEAESVLDDGFGFDFRA